MTMVILRSEKPGDRALRERRRAAIQAIEWQVHIRPNLWAPPADLFETETAYIVRVEVAGMRDQEISVTIEGDLLAISGSRADTPERRAFHQMEIRFGEFSVGVVLPGQVNEDAGSATYEDGFLLITLPKAETNLK
jgi:HSP20 family protein